MRQKSRLNIIVLVVLILLSFGLALMNEVSYFYKVKALVFPLFGILYYLNRTERSKLFLGFWILFSISELLVLTVDYFTDNFLYVVGNIIYMLSYFALIFYIIKHIDINFLIKKRLVYSILVFAMGVFIIFYLFKLDEIVYNEFLEMPEITTIEGEQFLLYAYDITLVLTLIVAFYAFLSLENFKSLLLFLGVIAIFVSELIQFANYYITDKVIFLFGSALFSYLSYYFIFKFGTSKFDNNEISTIKQLRLLDEKNNFLNK